MGGKVKVTDAIELISIKQRAEKATPGSWDINRSSDDDVFVTDIWFDGEDGGYAEIHGDTVASSNYNAEFIAHAREDVPALVAEVESLKADVERHLEDNVFLHNENIRLRKALEFYANENMHFRVDMYAESIVMQDEGKIARQALAGESDG